VADKSSGKPLELEALKLAHDELKKVSAARFADAIGLCWA
jgi:hypothetical protein